MTGKIKDDEAGLVASTRAPAKLNLFLELVRKRDDGYHDIDTVMVPIDWYDDLRIRRRSMAGVDLTANWLPSRDQFAQSLGLDADSAAANALLSIPTDESNLVCKALNRFADVFAIEGGFDAELIKRIPAGAGMGGASSDAASALRCAAVLCDLPTDSPELIAIAAEIGSDVPFFMGLPANSGDRSGSGIAAARATGRGEVLTDIALARPIDLVVVYPSVSLSTAKVYAASQVPETTQTADMLIRILSTFHDWGGQDLRGVLAGAMLNRLSDPARLLAPQIDEILKSVWRIGVVTCQLTGSGSACFAIVESPERAKRVAEKLQNEFLPRRNQGNGAIVQAARTTRVPTSVATQFTTWARRPTGR